MIDISDDNDKNFLLLSILNIFRKIITIATQIKKKLLREYPL